MVVVAASVGFSAWAHFPLNAIQATSVALGVFAVEVAGYMFFWKSFVYNTMADKIHTLSVSETENAKEVERLTNELNRVRSEFKGVAIEEMEPIISELEVIGTLVKQIAENSIEFDNRLVTVENQPASPAPPPPTTSNKSTKSRKVTTINDRDEFGWQEDAEKEAIEVKPKAKPKKPDKRIVEAVNHAVDHNQVDIFLQPIMTLPDRKPKYYEALSRIRNQEGQMIRPSQYVNTAEITGTMPLLDKMQLIRVIQVLRRLIARKSDSVVVCNISATSLGDVVFFDDFRKLLRAKEELSNHLIFEFSQKTIREMGPIEEESLRALKSLGFMFSMDNVNDLSVDYRKLASLGFHFIKVTLPVLAAAKRSGVNDLHVEDLARYLSRNGIQMIVDQIETEAQAVELLNYETTMAQGYLFGGPKEVKTEPPLTSSKILSSKRVTG